MYCIQKYVKLFKWIIREGIAKKDGVEIMYRDYGAESSKPILMVHGLGCTTCSLGSSPNRFFS